MFLGCFWDVSRMFLTKEPHTMLQVLTPGNAAKPMNTRCREASGKVEGCSSHEFGDIPRDGKNIPRDGKHIPRDGMNTLECGGNVCAAFVDRLSNVEMWREQGPYGSSMQGSCGQEAPKAQPKALDSPGPGTLASSPFKGLSSTWVALG